MLRICGCPATVISWSVIYGFVFAVHGGHHVLNGHTFQLGIFFLTKVLKCV